MKDLEKRKKLVLLINSELKKLFPTASIVLRYSNNWELMVAVQLSAQCTDKKVNEVTEKLFKKYPKFEDYLKVDPHEFEKDIYQTGFYHNKAKNILGAAKIIKEKYEGEIPDTMEEILKLPGVARKTANVVLGNAYGVVEGIAVDTHVKRLSKLLRLTDEVDPVKIERDLMELLPASEWFGFTYLLIDYGRKFCVAKKHDHANCPLTRLLSKNS